MGQGQGRSRGTRAQRTPGRPRTLAWRRPQQGEHGGDEPLRYLQRGLLPQSVLQEVRIYRLTRDPENACRPLLRAQRRTRLGGVDQRVKASHASIGAALGCAPTDGPLRFGAYWSAIRQGGAISDTSRSRQSPGRYWDRSASSSWRNPQKAAGFPPSA